MVSADGDVRRDGTIWMSNLDQPAPVIEPLAPVEFCRVYSDSAAELTQVMGSDSSTEIQNRFESGRRCYAVRVNGGIASYGWASLDEEYVGELNLRLRLVPGEAYIWNCATVPFFRRKYLYSSLLVYIRRMLKDEGFCRAWIGADLDNLPSQRGIARAGFIHVANLVIARVLTLRQVWVQGRPNMPAEWVDEARRVFLGNRDGVWLRASASREAGG